VVLNRKHIKHAILNYSDEANLGSSRRALHLRDTSTMLGTCFVSYHSSSAPIQNPSCGDGDDGVSYRQPKGSIWISSPVRV